MSATRAIPITVVTLAVASVALGTSFVVPTDEWLIARSDAIVTGTIVDVRTETGARGLLRTVYTLRVDESLKGLAPEVAEIEVTELGGVRGDEMLAVAGAPVYETGRRYLVFLRKAGDRWSTFDLMMGAFAFRADAGGEQVLVRDEHVARETEAMSGTSAVRRASDFIHRVRETVRHAPLRETRLETGADAEEQPGDLGLAALVAAGAWSGDESSAIRYSVSSVPAGGTATGNDGEDRIVPGDPDDIIPGTLGVDSSVIAVAIYGCRAGGCLTVDDPVTGRRFAGIEWADVLLNDVGSGVVLSQAFLNTVVAHEMGHTLGFRHSNRLKNDADLGSPDYACSAPLPCSTNAVMTATINETHNGALSPWDRDAANAVYGDGTRGFDPVEFVDDLYVERTAEWLPSKRFDTDVEWRLPPAPCAPLAIVEQPVSAIIGPGEGVTLEVTASAEPIDVRWYEGETGNTRYPAGSGTPLVVKSLSRSTSYWAMVSNGCSAVASEPATIMVREACEPHELCALSSRFHVSLRATDQRTRASARGVPKPENDLFGSFSLPELTGNAENPEVFVKLLDGREINGQFWVFYGGLTDLDYVLTVTDVDTGDVRTYHKPAGSSAGGFDVGSGVAGESCSAEVDGIALTRVAISDCQADGRGLCLENGRFRVELEAKDPRTGARGTGSSIVQNDLAGYFSLPALTGNPDNPEVFVKVLDGRGVNGHFWVFFSGLTDLEYTIVVTDLDSGARKAYRKPAGSACGAFDTNAF